MAKSRRDDRASKRLRKFIAIVESSSAKDRFRNLDPDLNLLADRIRNAVRVDECSEWTPVASHVVSGLRAVGFSAQQEKLLVVSSSGRGLFDCLTGERVGRSVEEIFGQGAPYNPYSLIATGIGEVADEQISVTGIDGGGLATCNPGKWMLTRTSVGWPQ